MTLTHDPIPADPNDPKWIEARRTFIGASDAPAVLGISPWSTPLDVWADKLNIPGGFTGSLATDIGHELEDLIAREWAKRNHKNVVNTKLTERHREYPHIAASVDRDVVRIVGEPREHVECKVVGPNVAWTWKQGVPVYVQAQVQIQMAVTGARRVHVCALLIDRGYDWQSWTIERDDAVIHEIVERLNQFWHENVEGQVRPDIDVGWSANKTRDALSRIYAEPEPGSAVRLGVEATELIDGVKRAKALRKDLDADIDQCENALRAMLGDATDGFVDDNAKPVVTWRPQKRTSYDTKAVLSGRIDGFTDEEIDIAKRVLRAAEMTSTSRVLRIS